ncbi:MAG: hypothetical protein M3151_08110 [Actinomycetota bacterium]|nr:hypothetical protein [Actinomycetota bacterium]
MAPYEPPRQSLRGQLVDAVFILVLLFATLFVSTYVLSLQAGGAAGGEAAQPRPISELPISSAEKQQFQKMIDAGMVDLQAVNDSVAANRASADKYAFSVLSLFVTAAIIIAYMAFVYQLSFKEYREVIEEKFGPSEGGRT